MSGCCVAISSIARFDAGAMCEPKSQPWIAETGWPIWIVITFTAVHVSTSYDETSVWYSTEPLLRVPSEFLASKPSLTHASLQ